MVKNIVLTKGYYAIVDDIDNDLSNFNWIAATHKRDPSIVYAQNNIYFPDDVRRTIIMHRIILGRMINRDLYPKEHCDHIDGNGLNNTRSNLRLATMCENRKNSAKKDKSCSSHFKGVSWYKQSNKWHAEIGSNKIRYSIGYFNDEIEAAKAYDIKAKELHQEFARLNFPDEK
jgi:hypothetical protein